MMFGLFKRKEERATLRTPTSWLLGNNKVSSGVSVNETTALQYSAVYAAIRLLSESVASLPLHTYQRQETGKQRATAHPVARLLAGSVNPRMSSYSFRETIMGHALTYGNGFAEIVRDGSGNPVELLIITPDRVTVKQDDNGAIYYLVDESLRLSADDVFHIAGLGFDGIVGYSPIKLAKECIGLGLGAERFGGSFFGNSAKPAGVLSHPNRLSAEAAENLRNTWRTAYQGVDNAGRTAILEEGMSWQSLGISNDDAQYLETRKFQITEIARWYGVPPHMIGDLDNATFSNIEHQGIEFVTYSLRPWLVRWEQEIKRKLFIDDVYFSEFLVDGLLRGDTKTRYDGYKIARETGWLSVNEIRSLENLNGVDGGDTYIQPMNMEPMGTEPEADEDNQRSWIEPLLDDSFYRAKRLQENGERLALKRKGDHYGEWRTKWATNELPALFDEIISPAFEAVYRSQNLAEDKEMHIRISEISRRLISHDGSIDDFTKIIIGELR
jgi:HK97 family phage portal protein